MSTSGLCFSLLTLPIELYQYQFLHQDLHNSIVKVVEVEKKSEINYHHDQTLKKGESNIK